MERKLATIRKIAEIKPIEGADVICAYRVDGWWVVGKIGEFEVGDLVSFFEIDSFIPNSIAPFLSKGKEPREFNGIKGEKLRTVKLKGQISQGLILSLDVLGEWYTFQEGDDITEILNIQKWEMPLSPYMKTLAKGSFPSFIPKTDEERIQNLTYEFEEYKSLGYVWEVTEKLDGSSMTVYYKDGIFGVCSRNLELKDDDCHFTSTSKKYNIQEKLENFGKNIAIQGELIGPGIQGNKYNLNEHKFYAFTIYNIDDCCYLNSVDRLKICRLLDIEHIPGWHCENLHDFDISELLKYAEGKSVLYNTEREGVVLKCIDNPELHFKVISNKFLLIEK